MFKNAAKYLRGAYLYKRIQGVLNEIFEGIDRKDVKLRGELLEGACFTLTNLVLRPSLIASLNLPVILKSGTIGKLSITGLDSAAAKSGKISVVVSDVTFIFACPSDTEDLTPEHIVAARRTLLDFLSVKGVAYWSDSSLRGFLETVFSANEWDNKQKKTKEGSSKLAEEVANRAKYFEWMEYAYKNVELVVTNFHIRFEGTRSKVGRVASVGLTLPALRFRPTETQNILPMLPADTGKDAPFSKTMKEIFRLFLVQNLAVYVDVDVPSYLDELFPTKTTGTTSHDEGPDKESRDNKKVAEGERKINWLRHQWSNDRHDALLFPVNASTLTTFLFDPKGSKRFFSDLVQVKVGPVRVCMGTRQLNALGRIVDQIMKRTRRGDTLQYLFEDAAKKRTPPHMPPPPFSKAAPLGSILPLPCSIGETVLDIRETGRSALRWNRKLFGEKWARGMWRWAYNCVRSDLGQKDHESDLSMVAGAVVGGSFDRLVNLYKMRHAEALKLMAAVAACASNQRKSSRSNPPPPDADAADIAILQQEKQEADKASLFVPLMLNDPLDEDLEWELAGLEVCTPPKVTLLARRLASLELTLETRRQPLNNIERRILTADYVRFVGYKHQGVFLSHMGQFQCSSLLGPVSSDQSSEESEAKGSRGGNQRWLFGFGGRKHAEAGNVKSEERRPGSPEEGSRYQFSGKNAAISVVESLDGEETSEAEKGTEETIDDNAAIGEDESEENTTGKDEKATEATEAPLLTSPGTDEDTFLATVGFNSDNEDDDSEEEVKPDTPTVAELVAVATPVKQGKPPTPPPKPVTSPKPAVPPKPVTVSKEEMESHQSKTVNVPKVVTYRGKRPLIRSLMVAVDGSVSVEFRVATVKAKKQSLFRVGAEGVSGTLNFERDHIKLGSSISSIEVLQWITQENIDLAEKRERFSEEVKMSELASMTSKLTPIPRTPIKASVEQNNPSVPSGDPSSPTFVDNWLQSLGDVFLEHVATKRRIYASSHCEWEVGVGSIVASEKREFRDTVWRLKAANDMSGVVIDNVESGRKLFARKHAPRKGGRKKDIQHLQHFGAGPRDAQVFPDNIWRLTRLSRGPTERGSYRVIFRNELSDRYLIASANESGSVGAVEKSETIGDLEWEVIPVDLTIPPKQTLAKPETTEVTENVPLPVSGQVKSPTDGEAGQVGSEVPEEVPEVLATARQCLSDGLITQAEFQQLVGHHMSFLEAAEKEVANARESTTMVVPEKEGHPTLLMRSSTLSDSGQVPKKFMSISLRKYDSDYPKWELGIESFQTIHAAIGPKLDSLLSGSTTQQLEVLGDETGEVIEKKAALKECISALSHLAECGKAHKKFRTFESIQGTGLYAKLLASIASPTPSDVLLRITVPALSLTRDYSMGQLEAEPIRSLTELEAIQTELSHRGSRLKAMFSVGGSKIMSAEVVKSPQSIQFLSDRMATATKQHLDAIAQFVAENEEE